MRELTFNEIQIVSGGIAPAAPADCNIGYGDLAGGALLGGITGGLDGARVGGLWGALGGAVFGAAMGAFAAAFADSIRIYACQIHQNPA